MGNDKINHDFILRTNRPQRGTQLYETIYQLRTLINLWFKKIKKIGVHSVPKFMFVCNPLDSRDISDTTANERFMKSVEEMSAESG